MKSKLKTYPIKGLCIFLVIAIIASVALLVLFAIRYNQENPVVAIVVFVMCGLFAVAGLIALIDQLFHYIELKDDVLIDHIITYSKKVKIDKISSIVLKDGMYNVYKNKEYQFQFSSQVKGTDKIIVALERKGVKIE